MHIRLLEIAQIELDDSIEYYNSESGGLGDEFLVEALHAIDRIKNFSRHGTHPQTLPVGANCVASLTESYIR